MFLLIVFVALIFLEKHKEWEITKFKQVLLRVCIGKEYKLTLHFRNFDVMPKFNLGDTKIN